MRTICIVTGSRAEWGLLSGLAKKLIAGDYKIPVGASQEEVARIITGGK